MTEDLKKLDEERKQRLHDWFIEEPGIWQDIVEELRISLYNEEGKLKSRTCTNREWSAGYVFGYEEALTLERKMRLWTKQ